MTDLIPAAGRLAAIAKIKLQKQKLGKSSRGNVGSSSDSNLQLPSPRFSMQIVNWRIYGELQMTAANPHKGEVLWMNPFWSS
jgi:hypothetical protein